MRSFRRNDRGLSEIVGTLMLVLIVVTAATLLAAFVATYQAQLQKEQAYSHDQSLESIHILSLNTTLNKAGTGFANFGFTLASGYINPSIILGITLNNEPLLHFNWTNPDNSTSGSLRAGQDLTIPPFEEVQIATDLNSKDTNYSFVTPPMPNQYLKFDVFTVLQNDFSRVFLPPVPLEVISEVNFTGTDSILLDGSSSFQPQGNASLVQWEWTVSNLTAPKPQYIGPLFGEEAEFADNLTASESYAVTLTVTNSNGLIGSTTLIYTAL